MRHLMIVGLLAATFCFGQESPPLDMRWTPVMEIPHAVGNPLCVPHNWVDSCTFPGPIYAWNLTLALKGNAEAAYQVGLAYLQGWGVKPSQERAEHWLLIGAQSQFERRRVGDIYRSGEYFPASLDKTDLWYRRAGDHSSLLDLARIYRTGSMGKVDPDMAIPLCLELLRGRDGYVRLAEFELGNMAIDGQYSSGDRRRDLGYARAITQELIGQEEYKLAWAYGSAMDLPGTPEVERAVVRSAASFDVDLAQTRIADEFPAMTAAERYAWTTIAGLHQQAANAEAQRTMNTMSAEERAAGAAAVLALEKTRRAAGAYYRSDDPLLSPDFAALEVSVEKYGDPEEQLRLAYHYEADIGGPKSLERAMGLYRLVRDQRVAVVRLRIGNEYLWGTNGFPRNSERGIQWYRFAAKAGSPLACTRLAEMNASGC